LLLGLASSLVSAQEGDQEGDEALTYVALPTGLTHKLARDDSGRLTVRLPLASVPDGPPISTLTAKLFDVQFDASRPNGVANDFEVTLQRANDERGDALLIETRAGAAPLRPGAYTLIVHVAPTSKPEAVQSVALVMQKVAPTLSTGTTVVVAHTMPFLWSMWERRDPGELLLREESRLADVTGLVLQAVRDQENSKPTSASLDLQTDPFTLLAGDSRRLNVAPTSAFPIGTSKGKIEIRTPDLTNVTSVNYEVRTRQHPAWIVVIAIVGVALGWLLRVQLKNRQLRLTAAIAASTAVQALKEAETRIAEPKFNEEIRKLLADLLTAARGKDAELTTTQAKAATDELKEIETKFEAEHKTAVTAANEFTELLRRKWTVPTAAARKLEAARARLDELARALGRNHLTEAKALRDSVTRHELLEAVNATRAWRVAISPYFAALAENPPPLADVERVSLTGAAKTLAQDPIEQLPSVDLETAKSELSTANTRYYQANDAFAKVREGVHRFLEWSLQTLDPGGESIPAVDRDRLAQTIEVQLASIANHIDAPEGRLVELRAISRLMQDTWLGFLGAHGSVPDAKKTKELLAKGEWTEATLAAVRPAATALGDEDSPTSGARERAGGAGWGVADGPSAESIGSMALPLQGTAAERAHFQRQIDEASGLQSVVVALAFIAGVYFLHVEAWVGTYKEILALASLAFLTDLTAEGVMKALKP
jgi:hypothetical protein